MVIDGIDAASYRAIGNVDSVKEIGADLSGSPIGCGAYVVLRGWVLQEHGHEPVDSLVVSVGTETPTTAIVGLPRPDVARNFGPSSLNAGFVAVLPITIPPGEYRVSFEARLHEQILTLDSDIVVTVDSPKDPLAGRHERRDRWAFAVDGLFRSDGTRLAAPGEADAVLPWDCSAYIKLWAIDLAARVPALRIVARSGGFDLPVLNGLTRADAASSVGVLSAVSCGFAVPICPPLSGTQSIELFAIGFDETFVRVGELRVTASRPVALTALPQSTGIMGKIDAFGVDGTERPPSDSLAVTAGTVLKVRGWAVDETGPLRCGAVFAVIDDGPSYEAAYGASRPDVAAALGASAVAPCEFEASIDTSLLTAGSHRISIVALTSRGDARACVGPSIVVNVTTAKQG